MTLGFCSFSSGSSGNSYLVCSRENAIIIDARISAKKIVNGLQECKIEKEMVKALLITHEHIDHVKSIKTSDSQVTRRSHRSYRKGRWIS